MSEAREPGLVRAASSPKTCRATRCCRTSRAGSATPSSRTASWHYDNIVLIGDALRTGHPSVGSGTRLAMQDSIALFDAYKACGADVPRMLDEFVRIRQPGSDALQQAAIKSTEWYENLGPKLRARSDLLRLRLPHAQRPRRPRRGAQARPRARGGLREAASRAARSDRTGGRPCSKAASPGPPRPRDRYRRARPVGRHHGRRDGRAHVRAGSRDKVAVVYGERAHRRYAELVRSRRRLALALLRPRPAAAAIASSCSCPTCPSSSSLYLALNYDRRDSGDGAARAPACRGAPLHPRLGRRRLPRRRSRRQLRLPADGGRDGRGVPCPAPRDRRRRAGAGPDARSTSLIGATAATPTMRRLAARAAATRRRLDDAAVGRHDVGVEADSAHAQRLRAQRAPVRRRPRASTATRCSWPSCRSATTTTSRRRACSAPSTPAARSCIADGHRHRGRVRHRRARTRHRHRGGGAADHQLARTATCRSASTCRRCKVVQNGGARLAPELRARLREQLRLHAAGDLRHGRRPDQHDAARRPRRRCCSRARARRSASSTRSRCSTTTTARCPTASPASW